MNWNRLFDYSWYGPAGMLYGTYKGGKHTLWGDMTGYTQYKNTQASLSAQIDYENYLKRGNERALADWHKNLPGKEIRYPEFSYPGQIERANTSIARAGFDYSTAAANYSGNFPYRTAGLYGIAGKLSRSL